MSGPTTLHVTQYAGETIPIVIGFQRSVAGVVFTLEHSGWATSTITGVGSEVSIPISEARSAVAVATHTYKLIANAGVEGSEEIAALGRWFIVSAEPVA